MSAPFTVDTGVRQGGLLPSVLFNLTLDEPSTWLKAGNIGCVSGSVGVSHGCVQMVQWPSVRALLGWVIHSVYILWPGT